MWPSRRLPGWLAFERIKPALVTGLALFVTSYVGDMVLERWGTPVTATILDNVAIAILGALALVFYLSASYEHHNYERARERMMMVGEVNRQVRAALGAIAQSAMLEDRDERLRRLDEATERIDKMLSDLGKLRER
jgi:hypothetical protein